MHGIEVERPAPRHHYQMGAIESDFNPLGRQTISTLTHGNAPLMFSFGT
jgi:hypothetical protein